MRKLILLTALVSYSSCADDVLCTDEIETLMLNSTKKIEAEIRRFALIESCLADPKIKENTPVHVLCKLVEPGCMVDPTIAIDFKISKVKGQIVINLPLTFSYSGKPSNRTQSVTNLELARKCAIKFYAKHGLKLDVTFQEKAGGRIALLDDTKFVDDTEWAMISKNGVTMTNERICGMVVHELGHHLGLEDGYAYFKCPKRKVLSETNIMNNSVTPSRASLNADQIDHITRYLCRDFKCK